MKATEQKNTVFKYMFHFLRCNLKNQNCIFTIFKCISLSEI